jgi:hypothetical protein
MSGKPGRRRTIRSLPSERLPTQKGPRLRPRPSKLTPVKTRVYFGNSVTRKLR